VIFKKLPKVNNLPFGENSPNLVTPDAMSTVARREVNFEIFSGMKCKGSRVRFLAYVEVMEKEPKQTFMYVCAAREIRFYIYKCHPIVLGKQMQFIDRVSLPRILPEAFFDFWTCVLHACETQALFDYLRDG
jgi:hypothetical protein